MTVAIPTLQASNQDLQTLKATLLSDLPLAKRFRALFTLKAIGTSEAVDIIAQGFSDPSALLGHELAYVLGQMKHPAALPYLQAVLENRDQDPMVRHEAAEAIGAIGLSESIPFLSKFLMDEEQVVRETVELAIDLLKQPPVENTNPYASVDPAPALPDKGLTTKALGDTLMDSNLSLFKRYQAMFALRNRGDAEAVQQLCRGFDDASALFRHEIAYVFGQLQHPASVPGLIKVLTNEEEQGMVRHEAAEALGSIATDECLPILKKFAQDKTRVVRESCEVGLDMFEYETSGAFQYAQPLASVE